MKHILVLLSLAVLLCSVAPVLGSLTCSKSSSDAAAHLAESRINDHRHHGYKFQLSETKLDTFAKVDGGCEFKLQLTLLETKCHVVNPKKYKDCERRKGTEREVMAKCHVLVSVKDGFADVSNYDCDIRQAKTNEEMGILCPDCPILAALNSAEAKKSAQEVLRKVNENPKHKRYYRLKEIGRVKSGHMMNVGMMYYTEVALEETSCPMGSKMAIENCRPRCPHLARHAVCRATYSDMHGVKSVKCEFYPASNPNPHLIGEEDPMCSVHPPRCRTSQDNVDPALHPICSYPYEFHGHTMP